MTKDTIPPITGHELPKGFPCKDHIISCKDALEELAQQKPLVWAPVSHLWGRQTPGEYSHQTERFIKTMYASSYGFDWLLQHPIWLYACTDYVFDHNNKLIIIDGHHRARYAPKYGITDMPAIVFFEPELVAITGHDDIGRGLYDEAANAMYEFSRSIPQGKPVRCSHTAANEKFVQLIHANFKPPAIVR